MHCHPFHIACRDVMRAFAYVMCASFTPVMRAFAQNTLACDASSCDANARIRVACESIYNASYTHSPLALRVLRVRYACIRSHAMRLRASKGNLCVSGTVNHTYTYRDLYIASVQCNGRNWPRNADFAPESPAKLLHSPILVAVGLSVRYKDKSKVTVLSPHLGSELS